MCKETKNRHFIITVYIYMPRDKNTYILVIFFVMLKTLLMLSV
jgi:hypothetical protein